MAEQERKPRHRYQRKLPRKENECGSEKSGIVSSSVRSRYQPSGSVAARSRSISSTPCFYSVVFDAWPSTSTRYSPAWNVSVSFREGQHRVWRRGYGSFCGQAAEEAICYGHASSRAHCRRACLCGRAFMRRRSMVARPVSVRPSTHHVSVDARKWSSHR